MKLSDLIAELQTIEREHGNTNIIISVNDPFSKYGNDASIDIEAKGGVWRGIRTAGNDTRIEVYLKYQKDYTENIMKRPKVTFRR